ncbi:MAG: RadC family protein [Clostridia bacterium]|nr:RadC family protein [Clostridia bacterium]
MDKKLHLGHRGRMRLKFIKDPSLLENHEIMELLLYYAIPRKNTNEEAHRLIKKFGSFRRVFDADQQQLEEVEGIGENASFFLRLISEGISRYSQDAHFITHPLTSRAALMEYLCSLFIGESKEKVYLILLSSSGKILKTEVVGSGFAGCSEISIQKMNALAVESGAASAVLAHNHPDGIPIPSQQDIITTQKIQLIFKQLGVTLIDHFIVVDNECVPILRNDKAFEETKPSSKRKTKKKK